MSNADSSDRKNALGNLPDQEQAKFVVLMWARDHLAKSDYAALKAGDVYVVRFDKALNNWKAVVLISLLDDIMHYEVTCNSYGDIYLDVYKKLDSVIFSIYK